MEKLVQTWKASCHMRVPPPWLHAYNGIAVELWRANQSQKWYILQVSFTVWFHSSIWLCSVHRETVCMLINWFTWQYSHEIVGSRDKWHDPDMAEPRYILQILKESLLVTFLNGKYIVNTTTPALGGHMQTLAEIKI